MRIVGGSLRGAALANLGAGDDAAHLRPTTDRVREAVFNLIAHGGYATPAPPVGARVLDLFAGSGALGFEALSRGAVHLTSVENGKTGARLIQQNMRALNVADRVTLLRQDATALGPCTAEPASLVFLDPPYGKGLGARALAAARQGGWLTDSALVVWEDSVESPPPPGFMLEDVRRYGSTIIQLLTASAP
ncbi:16S rRNA (guanine966-N2)-methyltransferase [Rubricella aquisinus]|uniref:16S rRNA (Guanine966-N2)-methyltransferase n=1 Tax=Rubricella aquisinus TaxID=2028108 RepID=A0A840X8F2_9RHOB|nr:RsmD family RNA methyltransferase [Rubricella aquisinus]MBB5516997.1 16S rRNA (guanine966-N2)-methyltransferase [Rubricella aquisinus]